MDIFCETKNFYTIIGDGDDLVKNSGYEV